MSDLGQAVSTVIERCLRIGETQVLDRGCFLL